MRIVFADTFYYLALFNPRDAAHLAATQFTSRFSGRMITSEWVLTELADAFSPASTRKSLANFITDLQSDPDVTIVPATHSLFERAFNLYSRRRDKDWSLTDCTSFVIMSEEGLTEALTVD